MHTVQAVIITTKSLDIQVVKYFPYVVIFLYLLLFLPFWKPVVIGILFATACGPLQLKIKTLLRARRRSVAYGVLVVTTVAMIAFIVILGIQIYASLNQIFEHQEIVAEWSNRLLALRDQILGWLEQKGILQSDNIRVQLTKTTANVTIWGRDTLIGLVRSLIEGAPQIILSGFVFLLSFASFLVMGERAYSSAARALGLRGKYHTHYLKFERICANSLGLVLLTGLLQSTLVLAGSLICGEGHYFIIFAVTFIFSMVPILGAAIVPCTIGAFELIQGDTTSAIILFATMAVAGVADNILKAWLFSKAAKTNPVISLISLIGGVTLIGFAGLFIAPTIEQLVMNEANSEEK